MELRLSARLAFRIGNERSDEALLQMYFLTYDGTTPQVNVAVDEASEPKWLLTGQIGEPGGGPPPPGPTTFQLRGHSPVVPTADDPYLAIVIRAIELDNSDDDDRSSDIDSVTAAIGAVPAQPDRATLLAAIGGIVPSDSGVDDDDDLIGSNVFVFPEQGGLESRTLPNFTLNGSTASYDFSSLLLERIDATRQADIELRASRIDDDDDAREFIRLTPASDLTALSATAADNLLEQLFSGPTGGDDERAIINLVRALPASTVVELQTRFGRTMDAYSAEVDGDNFIELRRILSNSIS